jgi:glycosyltransferase involved in cell wall biosynthesis
VIQILHGDSDYYYDLAARHENVIDAFVVYGRTMERKLKERLPHRSGDVHFLPYGMPRPPRRRAAASGPLRLLFAGRYEHGQKGVLDLPRIDRALVDRRVDVSWTMVGAGPDEDRLREAWRTPRVTFLGRKTAGEVMEIAAAHDVFVLPTRYEGVPVALLEAMSVGLVPVVSRVESGVAEILVDGQTGLMPPVGDVDAFADAIAALDRDRPMVESMSEAAWRYVEAHHDVRVRTDAYQALFSRYRELRRPRSPEAAVPYGSRLDRPWIPNVAVRTVRTMIRRARGKPS